MWNVGSATEVNVCCKQFDEMCLLCAWLVLIDFLCSMRPCLLTNSGKKQLESQFFSFTPEKNEKFLSIVLAVFSHSGGLCIQAFLQTSSLYL